LLKTTIGDYDVFVEF